MPWTIITWERLWQPWMWCTLWNDKAELCTDLVVRLHSLPTQTNGSFIRSHQISQKSWPINCVSIGVFTWYRGDFHPGASSLRFPLMALYSYTWYQHKMSCRRESYRREFTPVLVPARNSFRCHVNGVWLFVSYPLKFHQFYGTIRLAPQQTRLYVNTVQLFISPRNESRAVIM